MRRERMTPENFRSRIVVDDRGCWLWQRGLFSDGYGSVQVDGKKYGAHVLIYSWLVGPVPAGLELDHTCRVRRCVNPGHLEPVTHRENVLRGTSPVARHAAATRCKNGHEFDDANTYRHNGGRSCRACNLARVKAYKARKAAA